MSAFNNKYRLSGLSDHLLRNGTQTHFLHITYSVGTDNDQGNIFLRFCPYNLPERDAPLDFDRGLDS